MEGKRGDKGIWMKDHTIWKKSHMAVFAYFSKNKNRPSTYREIARAYVSSSYSNYKNACEELVKLGYLEKLDTGEFQVRQEDWEMVKSGKEIITRPLPYFRQYIKKIK